jgi:hypothetical protein
LKKLTLLILVIVVSWSYYTKSGGARNSAPSSSPIENKKSTSSNNNPNDYQCDGRQHCSQMNSHEEAKYFIENCPNTKMDGDNDGKPCERQFGRY